jgi:hypothetical protein
MDGLHVLRIDERYDSNSSGTITDADGWRPVEKNTNLPGDLTHLVAKSSYTYTSQTTSTGTATDYYYGYDPVGNLVAVSDDQGARAFDFSQDAFGNKLSVGAFARTDWAAARAAGVYEHQTGKDLDPFTGLYYFHARWGGLWGGIRFVIYQPMTFWTTPPVVLTPRKKNSNRGRSHSVRLKPGRLS